MTNRFDLWWKSNFKIKKNEEKNDEREMPPLPLWGQLKIITAMLILNLLFNFAICTNLMMKKPIQSDIYDKLLISKMTYLVFNIKAIKMKIEMKYFRFCWQKDWNKLMISKYGSKKGVWKIIRFESNKHKNWKIKDEDSTLTVAPNSNEKLKTLLIELKRMSIIVNECWEWRQSRLS